MFILKLFPSFRFRYSFFFSRYCDYFSPLNPRFQTLVFLFYDVQVGSKSDNKPLLILCKIIDSIFIESVKGTVNSFYYRFLSVKIFNNTIFFPILRVRMNDKSFVTVDIVENKIH